MPNAIVRAKARTLPEATNRRAVLSAVLAAGAAAPAPAVSTPLAATLAPTTPDAELLALARRAKAIPEERERALEDQKEARPRFYEILPKAPPGIVILDPSHPGAELYGTIGLISVWNLRKDLPGCSPRSRLGKWMKRALKLAEEWEEQRRRAERDSGLEAAELQVRRLDYELEELVQDAFAFPPSTAAGFVAQARIFLAGFDLADVSPNFKWSKSAFCYEFGPYLAEAAVAALRDGEAT